MATAPTHHVPRLAVSVNKAVESGLIDGGSNFLICYDGSLASRGSVSMMLDFFFKYDKKSKIDVLHIYDNAKQDELPLSLKKDTIEHDLMAYDVSWGARFTRHIRPKLNAATKEGKELVKFTYELESEDKTIDFLVLGELLNDCQDDRFFGAGVVVDDCLVELFLD